ncbi:hypothetical protein B0I35DRAFT_474394 [Stachybotrys elegans]|uniref:Uncharacterized protein n=1 Tax=Stachybotrys elegans TaxID=80388 RepID=A0A8K0SXN2_9HYPO|nr:hypothetical protein B0I35DRAFT_474394 [Stachybotrys elegans]
MSLSAIAAAQQVFEPVEGPSPRPQCRGKDFPNKPTYSFTPFSYTMTTTVRYATSAAPPTATTTYAAPSESLTSLLPPISYTTWGSWDPTATEAARDTDDPYGEAAWTALWEAADPPDFVPTGLYSTTVEPTPS